MSLSLVSSVAGLLEATDVALDSEALSPFDGATDVLLLAELVGALLVLVVVVALDTLGAVDVVADALVECVLVV